MKNLLPHRVSLVDHMPAVMRQGSRNTCAAAAAVVLAEYRFGAGTRLSVQYLFAETAKREQEWLARNIAVLRSGETPDAAFKAAYAAQMAELDLVREAADPKHDPLGHALVVVGYEDDPMNPGEGWFLLQNSWWTDTP